jgi:UDP-N-acetylglucosamine--N-acetylmuramyl-(pentapeptide) pyrophosphoryl-undecaprenol N-acetylglucosamine transferase
VYPALAVLQALGDKANPVLWVGGTGGIEASLVQRAGIPFTAIPAAGVHGVVLRTLPGNLWRLFQGTLSARRVVNEFKPDVLLFTGGYVGAPMALAAHSKPTLVYVPDIEPGLALKFLARFADTIAVTTEETRAYLPAGKKIIVTGYPTRPELGKWERSAARTALKLDKDLPVLLVFGGSKGARSLNRALINNLRSILKFCQVVHISGELDWQEVGTVQNDLSAEEKVRYHAVPYLYEEMGAALAAADLVVSRAGASILGEFPLFGLPAVLVPYPYAWRYQRVNADHLAKKGAAVVIEDKNLSVQLLNVTKNLLQSPDKLAQMRAVMKSLARPHAAEHLANLACQLADVSTGKTGGQV